MSKLFELYVLGKLKKRFGAEIKYHPTTYGNELDFLLSNGDNSMVIDAKYKPNYSVYVNHQDIRQVSGYARLTKIRKDAKVSPEKMLDCVIIYPDLENGSDSIIELKKDPIKEYEKVWKVGVRVPLKSNSIT